MKRSEATNGVHLGDCLQPAFQPETSFELFKQIVLKEQLHSIWISSPFFVDDLLDIYRRDNGQFCRSRFTKDDKTSPETRYRSVRTITSHVIGITSPSLYFLSSVPVSIWLSTTQSADAWNVPNNKHLLKLSSYHWRVCLQRIIDDFAHRNHCLLFQRLPDKLNGNRSIFVCDRIVYKGIFQCEFATA